MTVICLQDNEAVIESMVMRKNTKISEALNRKILLITESGLVRVLLDTYLGPSLNPNYVHTDGIALLYVRLSHFRVLAMLVLTFQMLSVVSLLLEILYHSRIDKKLSI